MSDQQSSYRQIMKATSLFGGVQVFNIIIQIIKSKFIAVFLGPTGMGIVGLLTSTMALVGGMTNFGIGTSAVKNIAEANTTGDKIRISTTVIIVQRLVWITGLFGTIIAMIISPWLSELTFGNRDYTLSFVWISITLLFNQLTSGQMVLMQGMRKLQYLAKSNLYGSILGLIITIPLYYKFGIKGVVPVIILTTVASLSLSWFYSRRIIIDPLKVSKARTIAESKNILALGFMISLSGLITLGAAYLVRIFISRYGSIADVGLYNAGFAIINTYVGLIFTAMATDYYPRLSAVADSNILSNQTINQQAEIALLILAPILIIFLVFINWVIVLLYSNQFIAINEMMYWAALGMFFKAATWAIGFLFLAKGSSKTFFYSELISNIYILIFNILGYYYWNLTGLGLSFLLGYIVCLIQVFLIAKIKYNFEFYHSFKKIFIIQLLLALCAFVVVKLLPHPYTYFVGSFFVAASLWFSYIELDKKVGIKVFIGRFLHNKVK